MVATLLKLAELQLLKLLQNAHLLRAVCSLQLQSLNMDASFLDRNVNEGFSGTQSSSLSPAMYIPTFRIVLILVDACMLFLLVLQASCC